MELSDEQEIIFSLRLQALIVNRCTEDCLYTAYWSKESKEKYGKIVQHHLIAV